MQAWFERGGMQSTLQALEMGEWNKLKMFQKLLEKKGSLEKYPLMIWQKYWSSSRLSTDFREAILRYANFLDYKKQILQKGKPKNYGASIREEVNALPDINDKAFKLSNDLLGAYDEVGVAGQWLRDYTILFWSWKEVNFKRYIRLAKNLSHDNNLSALVGRKAVSVVVRSPFIAYNIGKFMLKATALWSLLQVWNNTRFPDEEDQLPESVKSRPHIVFGKDDEGNIRYFSRLGALGDFLAWFGLDVAPQHVSDWLNGKKNLKEIGTEMAKSPVNVVASAVSPFYKTPLELVLRRSVYPNVFKPATIRDRGYYVAQQLGLENEYKALMGLPSRGYSKSLTGFYLYKSNPLETAYYEVMDDKREFLKKQGKTSEGFFLTPRSNALYNLKLALKYKDKVATDKYMTEYVNLGGTQKGLSQSLKMMHPLYGMNAVERKDFLDSLNSEDNEKVKMAERFYNEVIGEGKEKKTGVKKPHTEKAKQFQY